MTSVGYNSNTHAAEVGATILSITTFSMKILGMMGLFATLSIKDTA